MKYTGFLFLLGLLINTSSTSQTVWERLELWEQSIAETKASIDVHVVMRDANNLDMILDQSDIKIIQDHQGYYAKLFDFEFFATDKNGFSIDHLNKKIKISSVEDVKVATNNMLRMTALSSMASLVNVSMEKRNKSVYYSVHDKDENKLIMELVFDDASNNLLMMRQTVTKKVAVNDSYHQAVVELSYAYPSNQKRPVATKYVYEQNGNWTCAPSYQSYQLLAN